MSNYSVRTAAGRAAKGKALFATRNIIAGEAIIEDDVLLSMKIMDPSTFFPGEQDGDTNMVQSAIDTLDTQQRDDFLNLYYDQSRVPSNTSGDITGGWTANLDRVLTNRFEHHNADGSVQISVFKDCARANNSCVPNAYFYFGDDKKGIIRAVINIAKDEEITIAYLCNWMTRSERAKTMDWTRSGVVRCDCKACTDYTDDPERHAFYEASDARRQDLEQLRSLLHKYYPSEEKSSLKFRDICDAIEGSGGTLLGGTHQPQKLLLEAAERYVREMEREGIYDERYLTGLLMVVYFDDAVRSGSDCTSLRDRAAEHAKLLYGEGWRRFVQVYTPY
ncbi:hypothetical protein BLS_008629 [Venturia inaequalis]|uniref:SET domain-containing protein n=1 Tax=Venturia inaequalis TaxID=5025 RepID=A0A8H3VI80_VENIN|nr:hypothetical protein BLS_008629 [Venturia inaequalis]KAE9988236.1 hypothetical protein EG327_003450 [Venturia inaequalis]RDI78068.1 hypothetical protein Vi05172_g11921 [Venturia inaequalis]